MKYNPRQLHLQHSSVLPTTAIKTSIIYKYDKKTNEWGFSAWKCQHCETTLKFANSVIKHKTTCKQLNTNKKKDVPNANTSSDD